jgi:hypothetical protein
VFPKEGPQRESPYRGPRESHNGVSPQESQRGSATCGLPIIVQKRDSTREVPRGFLKGFRTRKVPQRGRAAVDPQAWSHKGSPRDSNVEGSKTGPKMRVSQGGTPWEPTRGSKQGGFHWGFSKTDLPGVPTMRFPKDHKGGPQAGNRKGIHQAGSPKRFP